MKFRYERPLLGALIALCACVAVAQDASAPAPLDGASGAVQPQDLLGTGELEFQDQDEPVLVGPDVSMYQFYITDLESRGGAYAEGLSEQLLGLGVAYQQQGLHKEAIKVFKRAVHLSRINNGLYSPQQIPLLQRLISSYVSAGEYGKADERQYYLYRVQRRAFSGDVNGLSEAMLARADWERTAYYLAVGENSFSRLLAMWELYRGAVSNIAEVEGHQSNALVRPLRGLLQTQYLIANYQGETAAQFEINGAGGEPSSAEQNRFALIRMSNYKQGQAVIGSLRDIYTHNEGPESPMPAQTSIMLGDWRTWYSKRDSAILDYQNAWDELAALENGEELLQQNFGAPVMLPNVDGIKPDEDLTAPATLTGYATVSFGVTERGRVVDLEVLDKQPVVEGVDKEPTRLLRRIKAKVFRPRFEDREPVATENIVRQYAY